MAPKDANKLQLQVQADHTNAIPEHKENTRRDNTINKAAANRLNGESLARRQSATFYRVLRGRTTTRVNSHLEHAYSTFGSPTTCYCDLLQHLDDSVNAVAQKVLEGAWRMTSTYIDRALSEFVIDEVPGS